MSVVVDASIPVAATTDAGPAGAWAEGVLTEAEIIAPHLVLVEATNVLRRLERPKELTALEATAALVCIPPLTGDFAGFNIVGLPGPSRLELPLHVKVRR